MFVLKSVLFKKGGFSDKLNYFDAFVFSGSFSQNRTSNPANTRLLHLLLLVLLVLLVLIVLIVLIVFLDELKT